MLIKKFLWSFPTVSLILVFFIYVSFSEHEQRKQLILTDNQNISTYHFQPIQLLQPNFITGGIRIFMPQHKQRKQLILTDNKIISTYLF